MRVEVVYLRDGLETEQPLCEAERLAMAERFFSALLASAFPGARVRISRGSRPEDTRVPLVGAARPAGE